jgi:hypothetical protein
MEREIEGMEREREGGEREKSGWRERRLDRGSSHTCSSQTSSLPNNNHNKGKRSLTETYYNLFMLLEEMS